MNSSRHALEIVETLISTLQSREHSQDVSRQEDCKGTSLIYLIALALLHPEQANLPHLGFREF